MCMYRLFTTYQLGPGQLPAAWVIQRCLPPIVLDVLNEGRSVLVMKHGWEEEVPVQQAMEVLPIIGLLDFLPIIHRSVNPTWRLGCL